MKNYVKPIILAESITYTKENVLGLWKNLGFSGLLLSIWQPSNKEGRLHIRNLEQSDLMTMLRNPVAI